ncbi:hypothetical protein Peur_004390 [Populus x canadensis]
MPTLCPPPSKSHHFHFPFSTHDFFPINRRSVFLSLLSDSSTLQCSRNPESIDC